MALSADTTPDLAPAEASAEATYDRLMPAEVKLIVASLVLGTILMGILVYVSYTFF